MMPKKRINIFSLAFLDCITCGLGSIILLFVIINAKSAAHQEAITSDLQAETDRMTVLVTEARKNLVSIQNALEKTNQDVAITQGLSRQVIEKISPKQSELAVRDESTLARKEHIDKLKADVLALDEELRRLKAGAKTEDEQGSRLRPFPGQGDRHYLTDLKMGGKRILFLVDSSASMLDETILGIIRRRNLEDTIKGRSPKWQQAVSTIEWLITRLPPTSNFQLYAFNESAQPVIAATENTWLDAGDVDRLNSAVRNLRRVIPQNGTSLLNAVQTIKKLIPQPDNVFILTDSLPTMGAGKPWGNRVSGSKRLKLFQNAVRQVPPGIPINIILYPMEGDPMAADAYWRLAKSTRGSFFCPAKDWP
jgi:hypothetical protein